MSSEESTVVDARAPTSGVERRIVTVLFADLVGFTSLSERLDPEDVATIQDAYFGSVRETVGRYGGQLEKFIGDAAMAVFGVPRARDDDAERAARAGLALVAAVGQLGARLGVDAGALRLRVGLNTGEVVHGTDGPDAGRVTGDTVNTAARLQAAADPSSVFVGEQTALAIAEAFELDAVPPLALKGKAEPVAARRIVAARAHRSRELAMGALRAPTVGREPELALLRDRIAAVAQQGAAERWLVVAPPGVGKTRLVDEVAATVAAGADRRTLVGRLRVRPETTDLFDPLRPFARDLLAAAGLDRPGRDELTRALESRGLRGPRAAVVADELLALARDGVDGTDLSGERGEPVQVGDDSFFVRHGDVAASPVRIGPAVGEEVGELPRLDVGRPILAPETQALEPEAVNERRLRMGDRITYHLGERQAAHVWSTPRSRRRPSSGRSGRPRTAKWLPSTASNNCAPRSSA
jgi:class 3 adenylate cyclase